MSSKLSAVLAALIPLLGRCSPLQSALLPTNTRMTWKITTPSIDSCGSSLHCSCRHLSICPSVCVCLSVCPSVCLSICLCNICGGALTAVCLPAPVDTCLSVCLCVCMSVCLSVCLCNICGGALLYVCLHLSMKQR